MHPAGRQHASGGFQPEVPAGLKAYPAVQSAVSCDKFIVHVCRPAQRVVGWRQGQNHAAVCCPAPASAPAVSSQAGAGARAMRGMMASPRLLEAMDLLRQPVPAVDCGSTGSSR